MYRTHRAYAQVGSIKTTFKEDQSFCVLSDLFTFPDESIHFLIEAVVSLTDKNIQGSVEQRSQLETITLEDSDDEIDRKKDDKCC